MKFKPIVFWWLLASSTVMVLAGYAIVYACLVERMPSSGHPFYYTPWSYDPSDLSSISRTNATMEPLFRPIHWVDPRLRAKFWDPRR